MNTELTKERITCPTGRRYGSVSDLIKHEAISPDIQSEMAKLEKETGLSQMLAIMRVRAGLTQQQMAEKADVTQSTISKWEMGPDRELTVHILSVYAAITGQRLSLLLGKPLNHIEAVKVHAFEIKKHLSALAEIANQVEEAEAAIQGFFGEAFFNILNILAKCQGRMPSVSAEFEVRFKSLDSSGSHTTAEPSSSELMAVV